MTHEQKGGTDSRVLSTDELGCRRMAKQLFNGGQQCGPLRLCLRHEIKSQTLKRTLGLLYVCLQGILFSGALEAATTIPGDIRPERDDCGQVAVVVLKNNDGRGLVTSAEAKQGVGERGAKCGAGIGNAASAIVAPSNEAAKGRKQDGPKNSVGVSEEGFNHFGFWFTVFFVWLVMWLSNDSMQSNEM